MSNEPGNQEAEAIQRLAAFVAQEMRTGSTKAEITAKLVATGIEESTASELVEKLHGHVSTVAAQQTLSTSRLVPAALGGLIAAVVGGLIWGWIVRVTNYEIGYVAWGIGVISGFAVVWLSGGKRGVPLQVIAVMSAFMGILIGKYVAFHGEVVRMVTQEEGAEAAKEVSVFSADLASIFVQNLQHIVNGFDILWVLLALGSAWRIPRSTFGYVPSDEA